MKKQFIELNLQGVQRGTGLCFVFVFVLLEGRVSLGNLAWLGALSVAWSDLRPMTHSS